VHPGHDREGQARGRERPPPGQHHPSYGATGAGATTGRGRTLGVEHAPTVGAVDRCSGTLSTGSGDRRPRGQSAAEDPLPEPLEPPEPLDEPDEAGVAFGDEDSDEPDDEESDEPLEDEESDEVDAVDDEPDEPPVAEDRLSLR